MMQPGDRLYEGDPGDKIKVTMHPMRDGSPAGSVVAVELPDGTVLMNAESTSRV
jgi:hypothetical protein